MAAMMRRLVVAGNRIRRTRASGTFIGIQRARGSCICNRFLRTAELVMVLVVAEGVGVEAGRREQMLVSRAAFVL